MLRRTMWLSGLMLVLAATAAQAQDAKKGRGGQGPGGFGGFGLGGFQASGAQLLGIAEVQKELSVSDEQKGLIEDMAAEMREQGRRAFGGGGGGFDFQNASEEERRKFREDMAKRFEEQNKKSDEMVSMILEPKQLDRLNQLKVQRDGVFGLLRDDMAKKLGLSAEQRDKMTKIRDEAFPRPEGGGLGGGGFQAFRNLQNASEEEKAAAKAKAQEEGKKMQERTDKARTDILALLTAEQKESYEKLQGKKFEFPAPQFGFGGGQPGGGRPENKKKNDK